MKRMIVALLAVTMLLSGCNADSQTLPKKTQDSAPKHPNGGYGPASPAVSGVIRFRAEWLSPLSVQITGTINDVEVEVRREGANPDNKVGSWYSFESGNHTVVPGDRVTLRVGAILTKNPGALKCVIIHHNMTVRTTENELNTKTNKREGSCFAAYELE